MGFPYLADKYWRDITRDERYFCTELFHALKGKEEPFVGWMNDTCLRQPFLTPAQVSSEWEAAFEVCFYRDYHHACNKTNAYSPKRTFDIALFGKEALVVIEAKAAMGFDTKQLDEFCQDKQQLEEITQAKVILLGLVASRYKSHMRATTESVFDGVLSWGDLEIVLGANAAFARADSLHNRTIMPD
jgi:hypothetical protein